MNQETKVIEVPDRAYRFGSLDTLQPGESTLFALPVNVASLRTGITYQQVRYGKRFTLRTLAEGIRVWRTA